MDTPKENSSTAFQEVEILGTEMAKAVHDAFYQIFLKDGELESALKSVVDYHFEHLSHHELLAWKAAGVAALKLFFKKSQIESSISSISHLEEL